MRDPWYVLDDRGERMGVYEGQAMAESVAEGHVGWRTTNNPEEGWALSEQDHLDLGHGPEDVEIVTLQRVRLLRPQIAGHWDPGPGISGAQWITDATFPVGTIGTLGEDVGNCGARSLVLVGKWKLVVPHAELEPIKST